MINLPAIYIANGTAILLLIVVLFSSKRPMRHGLLDEKIFFAMVLLNVMQCLMEMLTFSLIGKAGPRMLSLVLNTILFSNSVILAYFSAIYADFKLFADVKRVKRIYLLMAIPAILTIIGCLINFVTPVFFLIDHNNVYHRGKIYMVTYAVPYLYLAYGAILVYLNREKAHHRLFLPVSLFMIPVVIGTLLQLFFYGYSFMWLGVSIGLISLYVNLQNECCYLDELSGLFNRQYLNNLWLMYIEKKDCAGVAAGIMLDIDSFKNINDRFGHSVGDDAITAVGKILRTAVGDKGVPARYGGDEFIILMCVNSQKEITDMIDAIKTQTALFNESGKKPYQINFSIGYSTYDTKRDTSDIFFKKIDASMYEDKKRKISEGIISDRRRRD
jgi:diguanylate cyclase (GGDEF)-like protein